MKQCTICKNTLSENHFSKDRSRKDGLDHRCKKCSLSRQRKRSKNPEHRLWQYRNAAKRQKRNFFLSKEQFMEFWNKPCYYCGGNVEGIGIDRIDNKKGYEIDNIVSCCRGCNMMKWSLTKEKFIANCKRISHRF